ncbi:MAG: CAP domain-containing protein [Bacillota bacterium]
MVISILILAATLLPLATAQAYISPSSYYSQWSKYGVNYQRYYGAPIPVTPPVTPPTIPPTDPGVDPGTPPPSSGGFGDVDVLTAGERKIFDLVNQERVKAGLPAYTVDARLVKLARMKSQDMHDRNYFSHTSPTYGTAYRMEVNAGIRARVMGAENIARTYSVERAHVLFMNSEGHRANIMDARHDVIGIGVYSTSNTVWVTQLFLGD